MPRQRVTHNSSYIHVRSYVTGDIPLSSWPSTHRDTSGSTAAAEIASSYEERSAQGPPPLTNARIWFRVRSRILLSRETEREYVTTTSPRLLEHASRANRDIVKSTMRYREPNASTSYWRRCEIPETRGFHLRSGNLEPLLSCWQAYRPRRHRRFVHADVNVYAFYVVLLEKRGGIIFKIEFFFALRDISRHVATL